MGHTAFQHQALIYENSEEYLAETVPYIEAALRADEPTLVAVRAAQAKMLEQALGEDARRVRFAAIEAADHNPALTISLWRDFVDENPGRSVRGIGEPVWSEREPAVLEECHRHEALLNVAFASGRPWSLLCPYDAGALPEDVLERVGTSHRHICRKGNVEESPAFDSDPDCFSGELPPAVQPETIHFDLSGLSEVRRRVAAAAEREGMDPQGVEDLVIAASELAANSVMHGGGAGTLRLWCENGSLLTEVEDRGRIEDPLVGRFRPGITQEGGRGLWIANQLCDLVQIRSDAHGTVVRLHVLAREHVCV